MNFRKYLDGHLVGIPLQNRCGHKTADSAMADRKASNVHVYRVGDRLVGRGVTFSPLRPDNGTGSLRSDLFGPMSLVRRSRPAFPYASCRRLPRMAFGLRSRPSPPKTKKEPGRIIRPGGYLFGVHRLSPAIPARRFVVSGGTLECCSRFAVESADLAVVPACCLASSEPGRAQSFSLFIEGARGTTALS